MKKCQILIPLIFLLIISCNKTSETVSPINDEKPLLHKITLDGDLYKEFIYNSDDKLIQMNEYYNGIPNRSETYQYNTDGRLQKMTHDGMEATYEYNEKGLLASYTNFYAKTAYKWKEEYEYNSSNLIINAITFFKDERKGYIEYKYDIKGNIIERKQFDDLDNVLVSEQRKQFDDYRNPYKLNMPMDITCNNNITKYYYYSIVMSSLPREYESTFEYNSDELPIREIRTYNGGQKSIYEYEYLTD